MNAATTPAFNDAGRDLSGLSDARSFSFSVSPNAPVMTGRGEVQAVELLPGDMVITYVGTSRVRSCKLTAVHDPAVWLDPGAAGCEAAMYIPDDTHILIADWRVELLFDLSETLLPIRDLAGLPGIRVEAVNYLPVAVVEVDKPDAVGIGGLWVLCEPGPIKVGRASSAPLTRQQAILWEMIRGGNVA